MHNFML